MKLDAACCADVFGGLCLCLSDVFKEVVKRSKPPLASSALHLFVLPLADCSQCRQL